MHVSETSTWKRLSALLRARAGASLAQVLEGVRTVFAGDREARRRVAFSVALIALSAKMAKADGVVTPDEVDAFQQIFEIPQDEFANVSRLYNLARQDVGGFHLYARQVRSLFPSQDEDAEEVLTDVLDALFHIAKADGVLHESEVSFLAQVAQEFGFDATAFDRIKARHAVDGEGDPYAILGIDPSASFEDMRSTYLARVREMHPDRMIARGVPEEIVVMADERLAAMNAAWDRIVAMEAA